MPEFVDALNKALLSAVSALTDQTANLHQALRHLDDTLNNDPDLGALSPAESAALRAMLLSISNVMVQIALRDGKIALVHIQYAKLIKLALTPGPGASTVKWETLRFAQSYLLHIIDHDDVDKELYLSTLRLFFEFCFRHPFTQRGMFELSLLPTFGKTISTLLSLARSKNIGPNMKTQALEILLRLVQHSPVDWMNAMMPGTLSELSFTIRHEHSSDVIIIALKCFGLCVAKCLNNLAFQFARDREHLPLEDDEEHDNCDSPETKRIKTLLVKPNMQWFENSAANVKDLILDFIGVVLANQNEQVRDQVARFLYDLDCVHECLGLDLAVLQIDAAAIFVFNEKEAESTKELGERLISRVQEKVGKHFLAFVQDYIGRLGNDLVGKWASDCVFFNEHILFAIRMFASFRPLVMSGALRVFLIRLCQFVQIDDASIMACNFDADTFNDFYDSIPLRRSASMAWLRRVAEELTRQEPAEVVSLLYDLLRELDSEQHPVIVIILTYIGRRGKAPEEQVEVLGLCAEYLQELASSTDLELKESEDEIRSYAIGVSPRLVRFVLYICGSTALMAATSDLQGRDFILADTVCSILMNSASRHRCVYGSARQALKILASLYENNTSEFLLQRSDLIIDRITVWGAAHHAAPQILTGFITFVDSPVAYKEVKPIVETFLQLLDEKHEEYCLLIISALETFIETLARWFPVLAGDDPPSKQDIAELKKFVKPPPVRRPPWASDEEEFDDVEQTEPKPQSGKEPSEDDINDPATVDFENKEIPEQVKIAEAILLRTKHLLSSPCYAVKMTCLRLFQAALNVARHFDDVKLPMIHQNWTALRLRLTDDNVNLKIQAFTAIKVCCEVSNSFVYRKIRDSVWPLISNLLEKSIGRASYSESDAYKFIDVVLAHTYDIWKCIGYKKEDESLVAPALQRIAHEVKNSRHLASKASDVLRKLQRLSASNV